MSAKNMDKHNRWRNRTVAFRVSEEENQQIRERREKLNGMGINYLLNVGPDALGRIPSFCQEALRAAALR